MGRKWSLNHDYTEKQYKQFVEQVEEPLNCMVATLIADGVTINQIDTMMEHVSHTVWPEKQKDLFARRAELGRREIERMNITVRKKESVMAD